MSLFFLAIGLIVDKESLITLIQDSGEKLTSVINNYITIESSPAED